MKVSKDLRAGGSIRGTCCYLSEDAGRNGQVEHPVRSLPLLYSSTAGQLSTASNAVAKYGTECQLPPTSMPGSQ